MSATDAAGAHVSLCCRCVFDSRPPGRPGAARTRLLQHFRGWFVRTERPVFADTVPGRGRSAPLRAPARRYAPR
ncbi:lycopene cyclase family protein [Streptomyces flaveolus]|uniref:lycopene cyclase family protein n=1 Tax=Streptomyces flaveolus TaxID=67297 RepID=UPI0036FFF1F5